MNSGSDPWGFHNRGYPWGFHHRGSRGVLQGPMQGAAKVRQGFYSGLAKKDIKKGSRWVVVQNKVPFGDNRCRTIIGNNLTTA